MNVLLILNDPPYGSERSYNALRLAGSLANRDGHEVRVFLAGDAVACARSGQHVPDGYYNVESMLRVVANRGGKIGVCGSCMDARGLGETELVLGAHRSSLEELTDWTVWAGRVLVF